MDIDTTNEREIWDELKRRYHGALNEQLADQLLDLQANQDQGIGNYVSQTLVLVYP